MSALGYALPAIVALGVIGGYTAHVVNRAKGSLGESAAATSQPKVDPGEARWLKGALHVHTAKSGDSREPVENVVAAYERAGFDFIVLTDHNNVTVGQGTPNLLVIPGVELTQNVPSCEPPPEDDRGCAVHMNAWFVDPSRAHDVVFEPKSNSRLDLYRTEQNAAFALGGLVQLNHPNYKYTGADPAMIQMLGVRFLEVGNATTDVNADGDATHPSVEALWDAVLGSGARIFATATDDAHHYSAADIEAVRASGGSPSIIDQGYVMVRAKKDVRDIRRAMEEGDFYATLGPRMDQLEVRDGALLIRTDAPAVIRFIGEGGRVLQTVNGTEARQPVGRDSGSRYVRAVVERDGRKAWTQAFFTEDGSH